MSVRFDKNHRATSHQAPAPHAAHPHRPAATLNPTLADQTPDPAAFFDDTPDLSLGVQGGDAAALVLPDAGAPADANPTASRDEGFGFGGDTVSNPAAKEPAPDPKSALAKEALQALASDTPNGPEKMLKALNVFLPAGSPKTGLAERLGYPPPKAGALLLADLQQLLTQGRMSERLLQVKHWAERPVFGPERQRFVDALYFCNALFALGKAEQGARQAALRGTSVEQKAELKDRIAALNAWHDPIKKAQRADTKAWLSQLERSAEQASAAALAKSHPEKDRAAAAQRAAAALRELGEAQVRLSQYAEREKKKDQSEALRRRAVGLFARQGTMQAHEHVLKSEKFEHERLSGFAAAQAALEPLPSDSTSYLRAVAAVCSQSGQAAELELHTRGLSLDGSPSKIADGDAPRVEFLLRAVEDSHEAANDWNERAYAEVSARVARAKGPAQSAALREQREVLFEQVQLERAAVEFATARQRAAHRLQLHEERQPPDEIPTAEAADLALVAAEKAAEAARTDHWADAAELATINGVKTPWATTFKLYSQLSDAAKDGDMQRRNATAGVENAARNKARQMLQAGKSRPEILAYLAEHRLSHAIAGADTFTLASLQQQNLVAQRQMARDALGAARDFTLPLPINQLKVEQAEARLKEAEAAAARGPAEEPSSELRLLGRGQLYNAAPWSARMMRSAERLAEAQTHATKLDERTQLGALGMDLVARAKSVDDELEQQFAERRNALAERSANHLGAATAEGSDLLVREKGISVDDFLTAQAQFRLMDAGAAKIGVTPRFAELGAYHPLRWLLGTEQKQRELASEQARYDARLNIADRARQLQGVMQQAQADLADQRVRRHDLGARLMAASAPPNELWFQQAVLAADAGDRGGLTLAQQRLALLAPTEGRSERLELALTLAKRVNQVGEPLVAQAYEAQLASRRGEATPQERTLDQLAALQLAPTVAKRLAERGEAAKRSLRSDQRDLDIEVDGLAHVLFKLTPAAQASLSAGREKREEQARGAERAIDAAAKAQLGRALEIDNELAALPPAQRFARAALLWHQLGSDAVTGTTVTGTVTSNTVASKALSGLLATDASFGWNFRAPPSHAGANAVLANATSSGTAPEVFNSHQDHFKPALNWVRYHAPEIHGAQELVIALATAAATAGIGGAAVESATLSARIAAELSVSQGLALNAIRMSVSVGHCLAVMAAQNVASMSARAALGTSDVGAEFLGAALQFVALGRTSAIGDFKGFFGSLLVPVGATGSNLLVVDRIADPKLREYAEAVHMLAMALGPALHHTYSAWREDAARLAQTQSPRVAVEHYRQTLESHQVARVEIDHEVDQFAATLMLTLGDPIRDRDTLRAAEERAATLCSELDGAVDSRRVTKMVHDAGEVWLMGGGPAPAPLEGTGSLYAATSDTDSALPPMVHELLLRRHTLLPQHAATTHQLLTDLRAARPLVEWALGQAVATRGPSVEIAGTPPPHSNEWPQAIVRIWENGRYVELPAFHSGPNLGGISHGAQAGKDVFHVLREGVVTPMLVPLADVAWLHHTPEWRAVPVESMRDGHEVAHLLGTAADKHVIWLPNQKTFRVVERDAFHPIAQGASVVGQLNGELHQQMEALRDQPLKMFERMPAEERDAMRLGAARTLQSQLGREPTGGEVNRALPLWIRHHIDVTLQSAAHPEEQHALMKVLAVHHSFAAVERFRLGVQTFFHPATPTRQAYLRLSTLDGLAQVFQGSCGLTVAQKQRAQLSPLLALEYVAMGPKGIADDQARLARAAGAQALPLDVWHVPGVGAHATQRPPGASPGHEEGNAGVTSVEGAAVLTRQIGDLTGYSYAATAQVSGAIGAKHLEHYAWQQLGDPAARPQEGLWLTASVQSGGHAMQLQAARIGTAPDGSSIHLYTLYDPSNGTVVERTQDEIFNSNKDLGPGQMRARSLTVREPHEVSAWQQRFREQGDPATAALIKGLFGGYVTGVASNEARSSDVARLTKQAANEPSIELARQQLRALDALTNALRHKARIDPNVVEIAFQTGDDGHRLDAAIFCCKVFEALAQNEAKSLELGPRVSEQLILAVAQGDIHPIEALNLVYGLMHEACTTEVRQSFHREVEGLLSRRGLVRDFLKREVGAALKSKHELGLVAEPTALDTNVEPLAAGHLGDTKQATHLIMQLVADPSFRASPGVALAASESRSGSAAAQQQAGAKLKGAIAEHLTVQGLRAEFKNDHVVAGAKFCHEVPNAKTVAQYLALKTSGAGQFHWLPDPKRPGYGTTWKEIAEADALVCKSSPSGALTAHTSVEVKGGAFVNDGSSARAQLRRNVGFALSVVGRMMIVDGRSVRVKAFAPGPDGGISDAIPLLAAERHKVSLLTVGPSDGRGFDRQLPYTSSELSHVAQMMLQARGRDDLLRDQLAASAQGNTQGNTKGDQGGASHLPPWGPATVPNGEPARHLSESPGAFAPGVATMVNGASSDLALVAKRFEGNLEVAFRFSQRKAALEGVDTPQAQAELGLLNELEKRGERNPKLARAAFQCLEYGPPSMAGHLSQWLKADPMVTSRMLLLADALRPLTVANNIERERIDFLLPIISEHAFEGSLQLRGAIELLMRMPKQEFDARFGSAAAVEQVASLRALFDEVINGRSARANPVLGNRNGAGEADDKIPDTERIPESPAVATPSRTAALPGESPTATTRPRAAEPAEASRQGVRTVGPPRRTPAKPASLVDELAASVTDAEHREAIVASLRRLANQPGFVQLPPPAQRAALTLLSQHRSSVARDQLEEIFSSPGFAGLSPNEQATLLRLIRGQDKVLSGRGRWFFAELKEATDTEWRTAIMEQAWLKYIVPPDSASPPARAAGQTKLVGKGPVLTQDGRDIAGARYEVTVHGHTVRVAIADEAAPSGMYVPTIEMIELGLAQLSPAELLSLREVVVNSRPNSRDAVWRQVFDDPNFTSNATAENGLINIYPQRGAVSQGRVDVLLTHEVGHFVSTLALGPRSDQNAWKRWTDAIASDTFRASQYASKNANEDFSESWVLYRQVKGTADEASVRAMMPARFAVLDSIAASLRGPNSSDLRPLAPTQPMPSKGAPRAAAQRVSLRKPRL